jgi:aspartyl-tRNA synthetase
MASVFERAISLDIKPPFLRMPYAEAMERFGVDKPDLRFGIELKNLSSAFVGSGFKVFADVLARRESIYGIAVPGAHQLSRKDLDTMVEGVKTRHQMGLAWIKVNPDGWQGPIGKYLGDGEKNLAAKIADLKTGDTMLMVAGDADKVRPILGDLRLQLGARFNLRETGERKFVWVVDFPLFEFNPEEKRLFSVNHPFTAPNPEDLAIMESQPLKTRALAYDMVLNGEEMGGGSIRIHSRELQLKALELLGLTREEALDRFGFLIEALTYGAPPHGGIAFGVDRLIMMLCGTESIRDVIAFPKTQKAVDLMSGAPSEVSARQLRELSIKVTI